MGTTDRSQNAEILKNLLSSILAMAFFKKELDPRIKEKLPPGQRPTEKFPVLTYGETPKIDLKDWRFEVWGLVENKIILDYEEFMRLPNIIVNADLHCVTRFSVLNNLWEEVSFQEIAKLVRPKPEAKFVLIHCYGGNTTNLSLEALMEEDVLLANKRNGENLSVDHGWPLRLGIPRRYGWKSAKWVTGLEFLANDQPGFWEQNGYNNNADPWKEERYW